MKQIYRIGLPVQVTERMFKEELTNLIREIKEFGIIRGEKVKITSDSDSTTWISAHTEEIIDFIQICLKDLGFDEFGVRKDK